MDLKELLKSLSLKEKISELCLTGSNSNYVKDCIKEGLYGSVLNHYGKDHINDLQNLALKNGKNIPLLVGDDVIHGYRSIFPVPIGTACTFDLDLIYKLVCMSTEEASIDGINWIYSPMLDVTHDPRWGRIMETSGEDPYYSSLVGEQYVRAIQTPLLDGRRTAACCKHYIGYGASESGMDYNHTDFSEYRLRNLYLPTFRRAINAGAFSVMSSFNTYNGSAVTGSEFILKDVLRNELNFKGTIVTDWNTIGELVEYKQTKNDYYSALNSIKLGIDLDMHSDIYKDHLEKVIENNPEFLKYVDECVLRVLEMKEKMGLFEHPYVLENAYTMLNDNYRALCLEAAKKSIILFKNNNDVLPLQNEKVLFVGPFVNEHDSHLGAWACKGNKDDVISLQDALSDKNTIFYPTDFELSNLNYDDLGKMIETVDKVVLCLGEPRSFSGENNCRQYLDLPFNQEKLIDFVKNYHKPIICYITAGRSLGLESVHDKVDGLLFSFNLGIEAGNAVRDVLYGKHNPEGKTVVTFPRHVGQVPIYYNRFNVGRPTFLHFVDGKIEPLYPFGYGLHYGVLDIKNESVCYNGKLNISMDVENNSEYDISEVIQVYMSLPYYHKLRPVKEFIGYKKITILKNTYKNISFDIDLDSFIPNDADVDMDINIEVGTSSSNTKVFTIRRG